MYTQRDFSNTMHHALASEGVSGVEDTIQRIGDACFYESERQHAGEQGFLNLLNAYQTCFLNRNSLLPLDVVKIQQIAALVDPNENAQGFRSTPVTFANMSEGVPANNVPRAMESLVSAQSQLSVDEFIYEFLKIHPFSDGNGRTAWLMRVALIGHWLAPEKLPYYTF